MRSKALRRVLCAALAVCLLAAAMPVYAADGTGPIDVEFTDVPEDAWYAEYVYLCASWGIIDGKTETTYAPEDELTRGEFIKLLCMIGELAPYTMDVSIHWAQPYWYLLNDNGVLWGLDITCTYSALEQPITRYEMSVMINNLCNNVYSETPVTLESPSAVIGDYDTMASKYHEPVVQAYGKGILDGYDDGMFHGAEKSPQISRYTLCRGLIRLCIGGEHLIGQQRRDAVQQKNTAMIRLFQANRQVSSLFQGYKSLARPCRSVDAYPLQFIGVTWGLHGCYIITRASF